MKKVPDARRLANVAQLSNYTIHAEREGYIFPCVYGLLQAKNELTHNIMNLKLLELETELNPTSIMIDFEKTAMKCLKYTFNASIYIFFHLVFFI